MSRHGLFEIKQDGGADTLLDTRVYEFLGAHRAGNGYAFRTYQPRAIAVDIVGDFNSWGGWQMKNTGGGIWEIHTEYDLSLEGNCYKYRIYNEENSRLVSDPFARYSQWGSHDSSIVYTDNYEWGDGEWMSSKEKSTSVPINIYQLHLGSWKTRAGRHYSEGDAYLNYTDVAAELAGYASDMGYTHICFIDITEGGSNNAFSPTARYGKPDGLKLIVDILHRNNIGTIFEWNADIDLSDGSSETKNAFLTSNALYWLREFHADGLYVSGICDSSIIETVRRESEDALIITESGNLTDDQMLFSDKKWSEHVLDYAESDPQYKRFKYPRLNRSLVDGFGQNKILAITQRELSGGRAGLLNKMRGGYFERFARLRLFYCYMMTHPGKKLLFMGSEFGETSEWRREESLQWFLLEQDAHKMVKTFVKRLNHLYRDSSPLWENDSAWKGFRWIMPLEEQSGILAFERLSTDGESVLVAMNFTNNREREILLDGDAAFYEILLNSDLPEYGGKGRGRVSQGGSCAVISIPPLSALILKKK